MFLTTRSGGEYPPYRCQCPLTQPNKCRACKVHEHKRFRPRVVGGPRNYHKPIGLRPLTSVEHLKSHHAEIQQAIQAGVPYSVLARRYNIGDHPFIKYCQQTGIYQRRKPLTKKHP